VDDPFFLYDRFDQAINGVSSSQPTILMAHSPDILFPRADALVINLLDSFRKEDYFKDYGWEDSTRFGPESGDVYFEHDGMHTMRIQSRQYGVSVDTILLNPYEEIDDLLENNGHSRLEKMLREETINSKYPNLIVIPAKEVDSRRVHGKWKKKADRECLFRCRLKDHPAQTRKWQYQPLIAPRHFFEYDFNAHKGLKYHVWIRMKAHHGDPLSDSVYVQFSNAVDETGHARYRINQPAYSKVRMKDVDLLLTGHTHGGQVRIPFIGPLTTMSMTGNRYSAGLYRLDQTVLYVSRGYGTSLLPIRFHCPPEIAVFSFR
jgi:hypothetical protein